MSPRAVAVGPVELLLQHALDGQVQRADLGGEHVTCARVAAPRPQLDPDKPDHAYRALVRVKAFSCNYRDRFLMRSAAIAPPEGVPYAIGSEFAGEVLEVGAAVTRVVPGQLVMGDNQWPHEEPRHFRRGVPTNHASRELLLVREEKLCPAPAGMSVAVAAAFSVGAQTAYSMAAKLELNPGARVLVTAGSSNTSLFALAALRALGLEVYVTTGSAHCESRLRALGASDVFLVDPRAEQWLLHPGLRAAATRWGGFDAAFDPFFDAHLAKVLPFVRHGGRYVTCGLSDADLADTRAGALLREGLGIAIYRNQHLIANCAGQSQHLEQAKRDWLAGRLPVVIDSVHSGSELAAFLQRTYADRERFGKVVYTWDPQSAEVLEHAPRS
jgi:NADPH:quinone reductase-like Zn-dependent oxidoreductase